MVADGIGIETLVHTEPGIQKLIHVKKAEKHIAF
jgi:hypothetical protein